MIFGVIWLVAMVGLARRPERRAVVSAWIVALLGLGMAVALSRLVVTVPPVGTEVRPWVGSYLLIAFAALLVGGGIGVDGLAQADAGAQLQLAAAGRPRWPPWRSAWSAWGARSGG